MTSSEPPRDCDVAVVGAGIVGLAAARELALRHDEIRVAVLEREPRIAAHQTGHSSGVIHSGIYYEPGSLKARLCAGGARELYEYCDEHGLGARRSGKLIVATREDELERLAALERRGAANGVVGLRRLAANEIREVEPHAGGIAALHSPATGVVDFTRVAESFAAELAGHGGALITGCAVGAIDGDATIATVRHEGGTTRARAVVVCAGLWADRLARAAGAPGEPRIVPFRGNFLRLRQDRAALVRGSIYAVPDPALPFLGTHLTRGADGSVLLGPTAPSAGARRWVAEARRLVPELRAGDFEPAFAGIRAQAVARDGSLVDDFLVSRTGRCLHVRNAPSPAATASLPLARLIADEVEPLLQPGG